MKFSLGKAIEEIVAEISAITGRDTNFMDIDGQIIASTNLNRIGNIHKGAQRIINESLDELYITPDYEDEGTKAGLNLPIYVHDNIIGVIGITGSYQDVYPYARLVKRITEILLIDFLQKEKEHDRDMLQQEFLNTWILGDGIAEGEIFINRAKLLGINLKVLRRVIIVYCQEKSIDSSSFSSSLINEVNFAINGYLSNFEDTYYINKNNLFYITLPACSDTHLHKLTYDLYEILKNKFENNFFIGFDGIELGSSILSIPLLQAEQSYKAAILNKKPIFSYNNITIELLVENTSTTQKSDYLKKLFPENVREFIPHFMKIIEAWFENNGSIRDASEKLFMHKNTYQYQIKRILNCSGYDLRKPKSASIFYIALLFYRDLGELGV
jgi:carbohydrate diacid regulator